VATGMATEVGRIGVLLSGISEQQTPLERRLDALGHRLVAVALAVAGLVAWIGLQQGMAAGELLQTALALAVAAVPEGLPVVATIAMAVGVRRMARRRALIRHLPVVETLGSATVICTDKTGTLTAGEMTATVVRLEDVEVSVSGGGYAPEGEFRLNGARIDPLADPRLETALRICVLAARGAVTAEGGSWRAVGDPTEAALAALASKAGLNRSTLVAEWPQVSEVPFASERMFMASFHRTPSGLLACVKGAPRRVLQLSSRVLFIRDLARGRDPLRGDRRRMFSLAEVRKILESDKLHLLPDAAAELHKCVNILGYGGMRLGEDLVEIAARLARGEANLGPDECVTVAAKHVVLARAWMADDQLPELPATEAEPVAAATA